MNATTTEVTKADIATRYQRVRSFSLQIAEPLSPEDCAMQTMPDVSPTRWHLAHTTWFFETFILGQHEGYQCFDAAFEHLFNSYYNSVGEQFPRHRRGTLSRPGLPETLDYRSHVDESMQELLCDDCSHELLRVVELGLQHEQQHQELMLTDIKHVLYSNPLFPAYDAAAKLDQAEATEREWWHCEAQLIDVGHADDNFCFDNELPRHRTYLQEHSIASTCVTNGEYLKFMEDGGYEDPAHWLSLGWATVQQEKWQSPLYWRLKDGNWFEFTLGGLEPLDPNLPVTHISFYEADAYARWAGLRLPTEFEWEYWAGRQKTLPSRGFADLILQSSNCLHPQADTTNLLGSTWQWTASPYLAYPGYTAPNGALGEYNGKFMCNQFVLRGGSCATSGDHIRPTYRNFFPPDARWQFTGIRLAR